MKFAIETYTGAEASTFPELTGITRKVFGRKIIPQTIGEFEFTKFIFGMFGIWFPLDKQPFSGIIMSFSPDVLHFLSEIRFKTFYHRKSRSSIARELDRVCIVFLLISHTLPKRFRSLDCYQKSMSTRRVCRILRLRASVSNL